MRKRYSHPLVKTARHLDAESVVVLRHDQFFQRYFVEVERLWRWLGCKDVIDLSIFDLQELFCVFVIVIGWVASDGGCRRLVGGLGFDRERRDDVVFVIVDGWRTRSKTRNSVGVMIIRALLILDREVKLGEAESPAGEPAGRLRDVEQAVE